MATFNESDLLALLLKNTALRLVEPNIYSILPDDEAINEYDTRFGYIYDWVACNRIYNRLIWGYSINIFSQIANDALKSTKQGKVLDLGCGSLAFTANTYSQYSERPVVLVDQSLNMLRIAKSRLIKKSGEVPENLIFLHADALHLPFQDKTFETILCENLLHCIDNTSSLLEQLAKIISEDGKMYFTTLVKNSRFADKYIQALADRGKLVPRTMSDHKEIFDQVRLSIKYETIGSISIIYCEK
jgi:ubiquinone/menaquinone biosynthesis C-methylase UbiE